MPIHLGDPPRNSLSAIIHEFIRSSMLGQSYSNVKPNYENTIFSLLILFYLIFDSVLFCYYSVDFFFYCFANANELIIHIIANETPVVQLFVYVCMYVYRSCI